MWKGPQLGFAYQSCSTVHTLTCSMRETSTVSSAPTQNHILAQISLRIDCSIWWAIIFRISFCILCKVYDLFYWSHLLSSLESAARSFKSWYKFPFSSWCPRSGSACRARNSIEVKILHKQFLASTCCAANCLWSWRSTPILYDFPISKLLP